MIDRLKAADDHLNSGGFFRRQLAGPIEWKEPLSKRWVALVAGVPIAKVSYYFTLQRWLVQSLGGTHGHLGVKTFTSLRAAKAAVAKAWEKVR